MQKRIAVCCLLILLVIISNTGLAAPAEIREINKEIKNFDGKVGIYAKNLKTNRSIEYQEDVVFPTASTSKLVVAMAVYKYLYPKATPAKKAMYDTDIQYMMRVSDNESFYELLDELGAQKSNALNRVVRDLRLRRTEIHSEKALQKYRYRSVTTPYEMAKVFEALHKERYLAKEKSAAMKNDLANTIFKDEIPRFMQTKVMHKIGQLDDLLCDVGIVDDGKDQILISIYTITGRSEEYASDFIANMSAKLYNALRRKK